MQTKGSSVFADLIAKRELMQNPVRKLIPHCHAKIEYFELRKKEKWIATSELIDR